jgi:hypothetical protein
MRHGARAWSMDMESVSLREDLPCVSLTSQELGKVFLQIIVFYVTPTSGSREYEFMVAVG